MNVIIDLIFKQVISEYFEFRGYKVPDESEAFDFLVSEIGELADARVQARSDEWVRNNPDKPRNIENEAADVLMMLIAFCMASNIDLVHALRVKLESKGYKWPK